MKKEEIKINSKFGIINNRYYLDKILGEGYSGKVYQATDVKTKKIYAIKVFNEGEDELFENEVKINKKLSELNSPFFIKYIESSKGNFISEEKTEMINYIILEFEEKGEALNYISSPMGEKLSKVLFAKILQIVKTLHNTGIYHHDLKLDNFILDSHFNLKLGDFGFSSFVEKKENGRAKPQNIFSGTPKYMAPEVALKYSYDGEKADIFSLGVILFNIRLAKFGFTKFDLFGNKYLNLTNNLYKFIKDDKKELYWANFIDINDLSEEFKDLYFKMVACAPKKRPSIEEIYNHEWMKEIRDLNDEELEKYNQELINEFKSREEKMSKQTN